MWSSPSSTFFVSIVMLVFNNGYYLKSHKVNMKPVTWESSDGHHTPRGIFGTWLGFDKIEMKILFWLSVFACFFSIGLLPAELQLWSIEKRSTILPHARFLLASHYCHHHHHLLRNSISKGLTSKFLCVGNHTTIHSVNMFLRQWIRCECQIFGAACFLWWILLVTTIFVGNLLSAVIWGCWVQKYKYVEMQK